MARRKDPGLQARTGPARPVAEPGMSGEDEAPRIVPNKNRKLQVAPTRRKLFGAAAKDEFLEWFAATANISLAARKTGFHYRTAIRHWREDEAFGERCEEALKMGYPRLEALALRAAEEALKRALGEPIRGDREPPPEHFRMDPTTALQLLREHKRHLAGLTGGSGRGAKPGPPLTKWSFDAAFEALEKELDVFRRRTEAGDVPEIEEDEEEAGTGEADGGA
jgi:hypothetical protein